MYFSVGILYSAQQYLRFLKANPKIVSDFGSAFQMLDNVASAKAVFDTCQKCEWVRLDVGGYLEVTDKADAILSDLPIETVLRIQIQHLIEAYRPSWLPLLSKGRAEAMRFLPEDVAQCLREANLATSYDSDVVLWWDKVGKISRRLGKDEKVDVGRRGEQLSIKYERRRTQREPKWQGFETNLAGFDILSVVDIQHSEPLRIEVKTSNSIWEVASFHVSRNEWIVAQSSSNYVFHLWTLIPGNCLYVVPTATVDVHIPTNNGDGNWESVEIPFSAVCQKQEAASLD